MGNRYWFKPKIYGYGATPTTWEGWLLVVGYWAVVVAATAAAVALAEPRSLASAWQWAVWGAWLAVVAVATVALTVVSRRRTDGEWRWRFGRRAGAALREKWILARPPTDGEPHRR